MTSSRDSEIKARFAVTVLRVAQTADRPTAARLIQGLARDLPHPDERREIVELHFEAIEAFEKLAESLQQDSVASPSWRASADVASKWLSVVERS